MKIILLFKRVLNGDITEIAVSVIESFPFLPLKNPYFGRYYSQKHIKKHIFIIVIVSPGETHV